MYTHAVQPETQLTHPVLVIGKLGDPEPALEGNVRSAHGERAAHYVPDVVGVDVRRARLEVWVAGDGVRDGHGVREGRGKRGPVVLHLHEGGGGGKLPARVGYGARHDGVVLVDGPGGPERALQVARARVQVGLQAAHAHALPIVVLLQVGAQPERQRQLLHACE